MSRTQALEDTRTSRKWTAVVGEQGFVVIFILWILFLTFATRSFASLNNITTVLRQAAIIAIVAIGEHFIVLLGTMDISLPSILTVGGVLMGAQLVSLHVPPLAAGAVVVGAGALIGLGNGIIVTRLKINPIITTIGTMYILSGLAFVYTKGKTIYGDGITPINFIASGRFLGVSAPILIMFFLYIVFHLVLRHTTFGARIFATGNNEKASWLAGISVSRVKQNAFMLAGALAAFAGIMQVARQGSAAGGMGEDFLFPVLTAVVLGEERACPGARARSSTLSLRQCS